MSRVLSKVKSPLNSQGYTTKLDSSLTLPVINLETSHGIQGVEPHAQQPQNYQLESRHISVAVTRQSDTDKACGPYKSDRFSYTKQTISTREKQRNPHGLAVQTLDALQTDLRGSVKPKQAFIN